MPAIVANGVALHYEVHGNGPPLVCLGGWGSFCHGEHHHLPWGLTDHYSVVIVDYRGLGASGDDAAVPPTIQLYASDVIAVLEHLQLKSAHLLGMVGIGACIAQRIAIDRPDLCRSLTNSGSWCTVDRFLADQLQIFLDTHRTGGFLTFQQLVSVMSFEPDYYNRNAERLLGPDGVWKHINGRVETHARFIAASLQHETREQLSSVARPSLIVHAPLDVVTGPRTTQPIAEALSGCESVTIEGAAHVIAGRPLKERFSAVLLDFLSRH